MLDPGDFQFLEQLAAASIRFGLDHAAPLHASPRNASPALQRPLGAFVSLQKSGKNRGCQGDLVAKYSLFDSVRKAAFRSAFQDKRFSPVTAALFDSLELQVHVLDPEYRRAPGADQLLDARACEDSVLMRCGDKSAFFLATVCNMHKSSHALVEALRKKAGIEPGDAAEPERFFYIQTQCGKCLAARDIQELSYEW